MFARAFCLSLVIVCLWFALPCSPVVAAQHATSEKEERAAEPAQPQASEKQVTASSEAAVAFALLGSLTPDHMRQLGQMLEQDWKRRPEWGDMALAILKGERMRMGAGWWRPGIKRYDWSWLRGKFDANHDGAVSRDELPANETACDKLMARLDRDRDGKVSVADLEGTDSGDPASMMAGILFARWDTDSNGRISLDELAEFFAKSDDGALGFLTPDDLRAGIDDPAMRRQAGRGQGGEPPPAEMLRMFLSGEMGWLESGPEYGDTAPDFTLPVHDGSRTVTLSDSRARKPVALIFGSFT
jgi:Ca2+-binding EF-hand superfamily protein